VLVVAVVPTIAEAFRGVVQKTWFSPHVGVWLGGNFSAIHMRSLGFVPRFVLGLVSTDYLYLSDGNIWVSITAHFVQMPSSCLLCIYLTQRGCSNVTGGRCPGISNWYRRRCSGLLYFLYQAGYFGPAANAHLNTNGVKRTV
jgi:hypothetical protein